MFTAHIVTKQVCSEGKLNSLRDLLGSTDISAFSLHDGSQYFERLTDYLNIRHGLFPHWDICPVWHFRLPT